MKFYADENVNSSIVKALERRGFDILEIAGSNKSGESDLEHLKRAKEKTRVVITADEDFLRLDQNYGHAGIIFVTNQEISIGKSVREISKIADTIEKEEMKNHIEFI